jgi:hypothetical protein
MKELTRLDLTEKAQRLVKSLSDKQLIDGFIDIISRPKSPENNSVRIWLIDEIESRFENVHKSIEEYYASGSEDGLTYDQRILKAVKESVNV